MPLHHDQITRLLVFLSENGSSIEDLFVTILRQQPPGVYSTAVESIISNLQMLLETIFNDDRCRAMAIPWAHRYVDRHYAEQLLRLTKKESGWQFGVQNASNTQLEQFDLTSLTGVLDILQYLTAFLQIPESRKTSLVWSHFCNFCGM